jgi:hypothetical protein
MDQGGIIVPRWKAYVLDMLYRKEKRTVHFMLDMTDEQKHEILHSAQEVCTEIPMRCKSQKSIMKNAFLARKMEAFVLHAPDTENSKTWEFYAAVETLKDGFVGCFHGRKYSQRRFDSPSVMVFTDRFPKLKYIKPDFVHVFVAGKVAEQGGPELADRLEAEGYDRYL